MEAKKIMGSPRFEEVVQRFWHLLRANGANLENLTVTKTQYMDLIKRIYRVLLPVYREQEMNSEIE